MRRPSDERINAVALHAPEETGVPREGDGLALIQFERMRVEGIDQVVAGDGDDCTGNGEDRGSLLLEPSGPEVLGRAQVGKSIPFIGESRLVDLLDVAIRIQVEGKKHVGAFPGPLVASEPDELFQNEAPGCSLA